MTKRIRAEKFKDGWLVVIEDTRHIHCESDVYTTIRQEGLIVKTKQKAKKEVVIITAE